MPADCKYKEQVLNGEFHSLANSKVFQAWKKSPFFHWTTCSLEIRVKLGQAEWLKHKFHGRKRRAELDRI